jgi:hypothetical protein
VTVSGLVITGAVSGSADTGISSSQSIWLTGYDLTGGDGLVALQSVYLQEVGGTWWVIALVLALDAPSPATYAAVRVFYTYTA